MMQNPKIKKYIYCMYIMNDERYLTIRTDCVKTLILVCSLKMAMNLWSTFSHM
jgi:hypothetical protein